MRKITNEDIGRIHGQVWREMQAAWKEYKIHHQTTSSRKIKNSDFDMLLIYLIKKDIIK